MKSLSGSIKFWYHSICVGRICDIELEAGVVTSKDGAEAGAHVSGIIIPSLFVLGLEKLKQVKIWWT